MNYDNSKSIAILLGTYNGDKYIATQIDSLLNQTISDWTLYISDDGSTDKTPLIIERYAKNYSNIILIKNSTKKLGAKNNFLRLLEYVNSKYYMFCDQDDIWLPEKIEVSLYHMRKIEENSPKIPIVIHTDVILVDSKLKVIAKSFWKEVRINPDKLKHYNYLAICSYSLGCTMLFNSLAKEKSFPVNEKALMHDWWISTQVIKTGIIYSVYEQTMLYRQHENNVSGVEFGNKREFFTKIKQIKIVIKQNIQLYCTLKYIGYGSFWKFLFFKTIILLKTRLYDTLQ